MTTFIKGDPDAPVPDDGTTVVYDGAKGAYVPGPPPDIGTSGSSNLTVVSGSVTLDNSLPVGTLVGYRATASTTFTGQGGSVTLAAGAYIFERVTGGWEYRTIVEGTGLTPTAPDTTNPTAGTLAVTGVTHNAATLTVTGASDNQALHATPYAFSTNNGTTWTGWQSSNVYAATGLIPSTSYTFRHKVRDTSGNEATGAAVSRTTDAGPPPTLVVALSDTFTRADGSLAGHTADTGQPWTGSTATAQIVSGRLRPPSPTGVFCDIGGTALEVTFLVRFLDAGSDVRIYPWSNDTGTSGQRIYLDSTGVVNLLSATGVTTHSTPALTTGVDYAVRVTHLSGTVSVYVDDTLVVSATGPLPPAGTHLRIARGSMTLVSEIDDLEVKVAQ